MSKQHAGGILAKCGVIVLAAEGSACVTAEALRNTATACRKLTGPSPALLAEAQQLQLDRATHRVV